MGHSRINPWVLVLLALLLSTTAVLVIAPLTGTQRSTIIANAPKLTSAPAKCVEPGEQPHYAFYDPSKEWSGAAAPSIQAGTAREVARNYRNLICGIGVQGGDPVLLATAEAALAGSDEQLANMISQGQVWADQANTFDAYADWSGAYIRKSSDHKMAKTTIMMVSRPHYRAPHVRVIPAPHRTSLFLILPFKPDGKHVTKILKVRIACVQVYGIR
jgi:hypothetical protein